MNVKFRRFEQKDSKTLIDCIRDEYGDTYFRKNFYDEENLLKTFESAGINFFVAEKSGEIAGILGYDHLKYTCELTTGIINKKFRGQHISKPMFEYVIAEIRKQDTLSASGYPVLYHNTVQKILVNLDFKPVGFLLSDLMSANISSSYIGNDLKEFKKSYGLMIMKNKFDDVRKIHLPSEQVNFAGKIYRSLGLKIDIDTELHGLYGMTEIEFENDSIEKTCTITIKNSGEDLIRKIQELHSKFDSEQQTFNIYLDISDEKSVNAYEELIKCGYFFTGLKPICSEHEFMIMHNPRKTSVDFDKFILAQDFEQIRDYVKKQYERRIEK